MKEYYDLYAKGPQALCDRGAKQIPEAYVRPQHDRANPGNVVHAQHLPVIDLSGFHGDGRTKVIEELRYACETWGFFYVINHGFPQSSMNAMMEAVREFFQLPVEVKMRFFDDKPSSDTHYGISFSDRNCVSDWRDFLVQPCHPLHDEIVSLWPDVPPHYREIAREYSKNVRALALRLLALVSESLGLRESFLDEAFKDHDQLMVANHYPPCPQPDLTLGVIGHTDPNGISILHHDDVAGLQVFNDGFWYSVNSVPNAFAINIGDQLQILSNGRYKSAEHRVVVNAEKARFCIGTYYGPSYDAIIAPAIELVKQQADQSAEYGQVVYGEYLREFYSKDLGNMNYVKIQKK